MKKMKIHKTCRNSPSGSRSSKGGALSWVAAILAFSFFATSLSYAAPPVMNHVLVDRVDRVYDGDTITVTIFDWHPLFGRNISIRVRGVDTPEMRGKCVKEKFMAVKARDYVRSLIYKSQQLILRNLKRGKYFRLVADVYVDGMDISTLLIDEGLGVAYDGGGRGSWCD
jgi:micrococcal nuclease